MQQEPRGLTDTAAATMQRQTYYEYSHAGSTAAPLAAALDAIDAMRSFPLSHQIIGKATYRDSI